MKPRAQWWALFVIGGALVAGFATLYRLRLARGDFFPPYSSLRSDPLGTRALYDSLALLPGQTVSRWLQPVDRLAPSPARTILLAGLATEDWSEFTEEEFAALDVAVRGGCRLVIALQGTPVTEPKKNAPDESETTPPAPDREKNQGKKTPEPTRDPKKKGATPEDDDEEAAARPRLVDLAKRWEVELEQRALFGEAQRGVLAPSELPQKVRWENDAYFKPKSDSPWRILYRRGSRAVLLERRHGLGSIVLASDAYFLSNEALQRDRAPALLAWAIGKNAQVEFVESHLGLVEDPGVAALARRYGLGGAFFTFLLLTLLFVWRRMALFVPPSEAATSTVLEYNQTAGLEALLRRAVPPNELAQVCATEWRATARPPDIARVDDILAATPRGSAVSLYNAIVQALRRR